MYDGGVIYNKETLGVFHTQENFFLDDIPKNSKTIQLNTTFQIDFDKYIHVWIYNDEKTCKQYVISSKKQLPYFSDTDRHVLTIDISDLQEEISDIKIMYWHYGGKYKELIPVIYGMPPIESPCRVDASWEISQTYLVKQLPSRLFLFYPDLKSPSVVVRQYNDDKLIKVENIMVEKKYNTSIVVEGSSLKAVNKIVLNYKVSTIRDGEPSKNTAIEVNGNFLSNENSIQKEKGFGYQSFRLPREKNIHLKLDNIEGFKDEVLVTFKRDDKDIEVKKKIITKGDDNYIFISDIPLDDEDEVYFCSITLTSKDNTSKTSSINQYTPAASHGALNGTIDKCNDIILPFLLSNNTDIWSVIKKELDYEHWDKERKTDVVVDFVRNNKNMQTIIDPEESNHFYIVSKYGSFSSENIVKALLDKESEIKESLIDTIMIEIKAKINSFRKVKIKVYPSYIVDANLTEFMRKLNEGMLHYRNGDCDVKSASKLLCNVNERIKNNIVQLLEPTVNSDDDLDSVFNKIKDFLVKEKLITTIYDRFGSLTRKDKSDFILKTIIID